MGDGSRLRLGFWARVGGMEVMRLDPGKMRRGRGDGWGGGLRPELGGLIREGLGPRPQSSCGGGGALRHHLGPSPLSTPARGPAQPRPAPVLPSGPPWLQPRSSPARPAGPALSSGPQAAFAATTSQWPAEPSPPPPPPRPPSALHHWPQCARAPPAAGWET